MPAIEEMTLDEIESTLVRLRERRQVLKKTGKAAQRKIETLIRRRERYMDRVREIDEQIEMLKTESTGTPVNVPKRRGRRPKSETIDA